MKKLILSLALMFSTSVFALECGQFNFPTCTTASDQFDPSFLYETPYGGFGGGDCYVVNTPVIFIHGNGDQSINWDSPSSKEPFQSIYDVLKAKGYNDCELFGVTYLSLIERKTPQLNYHKPEKYKIIMDFINNVKEYTSRDQVIIIGHSLGVSMAIATLTYYDQWNSVEKFINIAGGIRGLDSCLYVGIANPMATTCAGQNYFNKFVFGFYPKYNEWTGDNTRFSMRDMPAKYPQVQFYTIHAGSHDEIHCGMAKGLRKCSDGALFDFTINVKSQVDIGEGSTASLLNKMGGDKDGVGHFKARNNAGEIIYNMLTTKCIDDECLKID